MQCDLAQIILQLHLAIEFDGGIGVGDLRDLVEVNKLDLNLNVPGWQLIRFYFSVSCS